MIPNLMCTLFMWTAVQAPTVTHTPALATSSAQAWAAFTPVHTTFVAEAAPEVQSAPRLTPAQVAEHVQQTYDKTRSFRASFKQVQLNATFGRTRKSSGTVTFAKPGMMRWDYETPVPKMFVSNGKVLWLYEPADKQAFKQALEASQLPAALSFLMGTGKLTEAFKVTEAASLNYGRPGDYRLSLKPKEPQSQYKAIYFIVDPQTFEVRQTILVDAQGNINDVTFENPKRNLKVSKAMFGWRPPKGVRVVDAASLGSR